MKKILIVLVVLVLALSMTTALADERDASVLLLDLFIEELRSVDGAFLFDFDDSFSFASETGGVVVAMATTLPGALFNIDPDATHELLSAMWEGFFMVHELVCDSPLYLGVWYQDEMLWLVDGDRLIDCQTEEEYRMVRSL